MDTDKAIQRLRGQKSELNRIGVTALSVFGSRARGDHSAASDLDLVVRVRRDRPFGLFALADLQYRLEEIAGLPIDLVLEPIHKRSLQVEIERARLNVF
jgi:uncharacterized protein